MLQTKDSLIKTIKTMDPQKIVFWLGAGVDYNYPTGLPLAKSLMESLLQYSCGSYYEDLKQHIERNFQNGIPRMETIISEIKLFEGELKRPTNILQGFSAFLDAPPNYCHFVLAEYLRSGANIVSMNYGNQIQKAYNSLYSTQLSDMPEFSGKFNMYIWSNKQSEGNIYYPHGDAYHLDNIGISLNEIKNSLSDEFCNEIAEWIYEGCCFIFAGYSCSDNFDVNPVFRKIDKGSNSSAIILNHVNEVSQEKVQETDFNRREFNEIFAPFEKNYVLHAVTDQVFCDIAITNKLKHKNFNTYDWKNEFFKYALKGNNEKSQKYLAIGICQVLDIADSTIVKKAHFKKSDNQFFKRNWYINYHLFRNADGINVIKYISRMKPNKDLLALSDIFSKFGLWNFAAKAMRKSPQTILDELEYIKLNKQTEKNIIDWDISTPLNRYADWFIMSLFCFPLRYKYYLEKHMEDAKTLMNCNDIIINMGNDVVKDVRQQYTAMRYLGILGMLFDNQYEVAMTHLKEASYQYDSASMNSGVTTCKLFMCLVEIDKCRKEKVGINLREKVEVLLNDIVQSAWNNRRNRLLKYIIMLYVKVYEKKFR